MAKWSLGVLAGLFSILVLVVVALLCVCVKIHQTVTKRKNCYWKIILKTKRFLNLQQHKKYILRFYTHIVSV